MAAEGNRRTADVRCKGFTNLFILSKNEFEGAMKDYPDAHKLLKKRAKYALFCIFLVNNCGDLGIQGTQLFLKYFFYFWKGSTLKGMNLLHFFPFRVDPFSKRTWRAGT